MSHPEILDDPGARYPHLEQFLGGYFHEDWPVTHARWEDCVDEFAAESGAAAVAAVTRELDAVLGHGFEDAQVAALLDGLGCSVEPAAFGLRASAWLDAVRTRLRPA